MSEQHKPEQDAPSDPSAEADSPSEDVATDGDEQVRAERADDSGPGSAARPAGRALHFMVVVALAFAFFAASASGFLWWQYRQFYVALDQADVESAESIREVRAQLRSLEDRIEALQGSDAMLRDARNDLEQRFEELPGRFLALEQRIDAVGGISDEVRRRWLRAEAEYYLVVANTELALGGHWQRAITALELADRALRELSNPAFGAVRRLISEELQALRSAELPDVEGLSYSLGRLADRVEELPMGVTAPGSFVSEPRELEDAQPGLDRVWLSLRQAVAGMINIQRSDAPASRALTAEEQVLARRRLELELEMARLGLLRGQPEVFQVSLGAARALLSRNFDESDSSVESAITLVDEMMRLQIDPPRPDISRSLNLLRGLADRDG